MPQRPKRMCSVCGTPSEEARCPRHRRPDRQHDTRRPSAAKRGYGRQWQRYRRWFLRRHPVCEQPGCGRPSTDVDHKTPVDGPDDPLFWDPTNHQARCHECHSRKTATADGGFGHRTAPPREG